MAYLEVETEPKGEPVAPMPPARTEWVCPMHPQIVRGEPGSCPICGMALEPRTVSPEDQPTPSSST